MRMSRIQEDMRPVARGWVSTQDWLEGEWDLYHKMRRYRVNTWHDLNVFVEDVIMLAYRRQHVGLLDVSVDQIEDAVRDWYAVSGMPRLLDWKSCPPV